ncbi:hypothetical protein [Vulcanisaeta sp. JCM 16161]|uniref:hypothetical protein n=1 Tax=Vulcanisaeta sp. JCM 16161 TaxID=1295372 RepID=UPI00406C338D
MRTKIYLLKENYTGYKLICNSLISQYNKLRSNYVLSTETETIKVKPILYLFIWGNNGFAIVFLNVTNIAAKPMIMFINIYAGPPISKEFRAYSTPILAPPNITISFPVMTVFFNSTFMHYMAYGISNSSIGNYSVDELMNMNLTITIEIRNSPTITYNTSIAEVVPLSKPVGLAMYLPSSIFANVTWIDLEIINPLPSTIIINGYSLYSYNGSLLTSCMLSKSLMVNATSTAEFDYLPTQTGPELMYTNKPIIVLSTTCTVNYAFPSNITELPYGYVVLSTSMGNITIPLLPLPLPVTPVPRNS